MISNKTFSLVLKKAFDTFDVEKKGSIGTQMVRTIFAMLGITTTEQILNEIIAEVDTDGTNNLVENPEVVI